MKIFHHSPMLVVLIAALLLSGCSGAVISPATLQNVDQTLTLSTVRQDIDAYIGRTVWWNGIILSTTNTAEGSILEILQKPSDPRGVPRDVDQSEGRFLAFYPAYLDAAIYSRDRKISVAGVIEQSQTRSLGQIEYIYPQLEVTELHLWPKEKPTEVIYIERPIPIGGFPYHPHRFP